MIEHTKQYTHFIGMDNGTGACGIALLSDSVVRYDKLPVKHEASYTKEERHISRLDAPGLRQLFTSWNLPKDSTLVTMERPMLNPMRWRASVSAARCLEAELVVIEEFGYDLEYIDSKQWQHVLLAGVEGSDNLKKASLEKAKQLYPQFKFKKDGDSMMIAHWAKNRALLEKPKAKPKKVL